MAKNESLLGGSGDVALEAVEDAVEDERMNWELQVSRALVESEEKVQTTLEREREEMRRDLQQAVSFERAQAMEEAKRTLAEGRFELAEKTSKLEQEYKEKEAILASDLRAEREREAADEIARGNEAAQRVRALADRTQVEIVSEAKRESEIIQIKQTNAVAKIERLFAGLVNPYFDQLRSRGVSRMLGSYATATDWNVIQAKKELSLIHI